MYIILFAKRKISMDAIEAFKIKIRVVRKERERYMQFKVFFLMRKVCWLIREFLVFSKFKEKFLLMIFLQHYHYLEEPTKKNRE